MVVFTGSSLTSGAYSVLPVSQLGTEYVIAMHFKMNAAATNDGFSITATVDNTIIRIALHAPGSGVKTFIYNNSTYNANGGQMTEYLDKYQTLQVREEFSVAVYYNICYI